VNSCNESSILFVRGSSSKYYYPPSKKKKRQVNPSILHPPTVQAHLIEGAHGRYKNNRRDIVEIGRPGMPLPARAANVVYSPGDGFAEDVHLEAVFEYAHGLDARV
jgi:hypothetical protein